MGGEGSRRKFTAHGKTAKLITPRLWREREERERERWRARQRRNYRFNMAGGYEAFIRDRSPILNENWNVGSLGGNSPRSSNFDKTADYSATSVRFLPPPNIGVYIYVGVRNFGGNPFESFPRIFRGIWKLSRDSSLSLCFDSSKTNFIDWFVIFIDSIYLSFFNFWRLKLQKIHCKYSINILARFRRKKKRASTFLIELIFTQLEDIRETCSNDMKYANKLRRC